MTTISIITQTSMYDIFGEIGCVVFGVSVFISVQLLVVGGLGMAVFRFICVENLMKQMGSFIDVFHSLLQSNRKFGF